jgi:hypothetical protein
MTDNLVLRGGMHVPSTDCEVADDQTAPPWTEIPTAVLLAELERRQDEPTKPACGGIERGAYDTPAHVAALILILSLSTIGKLDLPEDVANN